MFIGELVYACFVCTRRPKKHSYTHLACPLPKTHTHTQRIKHTLPPPQKNAPPATHIPTHPHMFTYAPPATRIPPPATRILTCIHNVSHMHLRPHPHPHTHTHTHTHTCTSSHTHIPTPPRTPPTCRSIQLPGKHNEAQQFCHQRVVRTLQC